MRVDSEAVYRGKMHLFTGHEIELCRDIFKCLYSSERRIIAVVVGYGKKIIAVGTIGCGNILRIVRTVGEVRVHMQIADKRIHTDEITGDGIDTESEAFLIAVGVFALDADAIFALIRECYRNIKSVFFVCGHIEFFSESGRRGVFDMSAVEPCYRCLMHTACGEKVVAAEGADMYSALLFGPNDLREHIVSPKFASSDKICHLILSLRKILSIYDSIKQPKKQSKEQKILKGSVTSEQTLFFNIRCRRRHSPSIRNTKSIRCRP